MHYVSGGGISSFEMSAVDIAFWDLRIKGWLCGEAGCVARLVVWLRLVVWRDWLCGEVGCVARLVVWRGW